MSNLASRNSRSKEPLVRIARECVVLDRVSRVERDPTLLEYKLLSFDSHLRDKNKTLNFSNISRNLKDRLQESILNALSILIIDLHI
ncbi:hypothetical protein PUN28_012393 [Cardiocondyla obscurior]|uniref:Uncharacterized protein n=1 Tax=Cardiocondyla obscurior TaxID=286306 RepID=A0AAW2FF79_9HYME